MKRLAAGVVALLVLLSLAGCEGLFVRHDVSEKPLRKQLSNVSTVVDVTSSVDNVFGRTVWVTVNKLVESDLQTVVADADKLLARGHVTFKIAFGKNNLLTIVYPNQFSADELSREVTYWLALSSAEGHPLGIILQAGKQGPYRNIWNPDGDGAVVKWQALRGVPDPGPSDRTWYFDGFVAEVGMPTPDVVAFKDKLVAIPLGKDESVTVDYFVAPSYVEVRYKSPDAGLADPTTSASRPRVEEVLTQLAALDLTQSNFVFITDDNKKGASLHLGGCTKVEPEEPHWASAQLAAALTSSGIKFPRGMSSGFCDDSDE
jgi:hypothetical protein